MLPNFNDEVVDIESDNENDNSLNSDSDDVANSEDSDNEITSKDSVSKITSEDFDHESSSEEGAEHFIGVFFIYHSSFFTNM